MINAIIRPRGQLDLLSEHEILLLEASRSERFSSIFRNCALAVLSCGSQEDDSHALFSAYPDFSISVVSSSRGLALSIKNAPETAFVEGKIINGLRDHLFSVLRDIIHLHQHVPVWQANGHSTSDIVFNILRNARTLKPRKKPNLIICWGGHAISNQEYDYAKEVGYRLGLRGMDICTGCGTGAMKAPMKGALVAHGKQRYNNTRYIGITEPEIIASEAPNAIVNELIIMPDIEKRLEAFVRLGHGIIVFPGGVGTCEEILYLLGILMHPKNKNVALPFILTGPDSSKDYFHVLDDFILSTLGEKAASYYEIILDDPIKVAQSMNKGLRLVTDKRKELKEAYHFNWLLHIEDDFQQPFEPSHKNMAELNLSVNQPPERFAANLRRAFSGIVAGNVKEEYINAIKKNGLYALSGDSGIMKKLDTLLNSFVKQQRMKISGDYKPCYTIQ